MRSAPTQRGTSTTGCQLIIPSVHSSGSHSFGPSPPLSRHPPPAVLTGLRRGKEVHAHATCSRQNVYNLISRWPYLFQLESRHVLLRWLDHGNTSPDQAHRDEGRVRGVRHRQSWRTIFFASCGCRRRHEDACNSDCKDERLACARMYAIARKIVLFMPAATADTVSTYSQGDRG